MLTILHISDLHICTESARESLVDFRELLQKRLPGVSWDIHIADSEVLSSLRRHIQTQDPDVLALTGDITALGDAESFRAAFEWLEPVLQRSGGRARPCLVVPGNHDALVDHLSALFSGRFCSLRPFEWKLIRVILRRYFALMAPLERYLDPRWTKANLLKNFHEFARRSGAIRTTPYKWSPKGQDSWHVVFFPFSTVSADPLWMNAGFARHAVWEQLNSSLEDPNFGLPGTVRVALAHHNPLSSPGKVEKELVHAYNSMPGGTEFLATLQKKGIDVLLHGHQHASALYRYDFDLGSAGHAFAVGAPAATAREEAGSILLEVEDVNNIKLTRFSYNPRDGFVKAAIQENPTHLALERHRPFDPATTAARYEIKGYSYREGDTEKLWEDVQGPGTSLVYMSGRHLKSVREDAFGPLRGVLRGSPAAKVRILVSDPELMRMVASSTERSNGNHYRADVWGTTEELEYISASAQDTIERLRGFFESLDSTQRAQIDLRASHTLLPFAAFVRDADTAWGKMTVKILPVGAIGDLESPVLRLNRRTDRALYDFYLAHLKYLFLKGVRLAGDWNQGEADLEAGLDHEVVTAIRREREGRTS